MDKIYNSVREIDKEFSDWINRYPDHYRYPISVANKMFERDLWSFLRKTSKKYASTRIEYLRILASVRRRYMKIK